jgi:DNA-directed RNA polymerase subunit K/omega
MRRKNSYISIKTFPSCSVELFLRTSFFYLSDWTGYFLSSKNTDQKILIGPKMLTRFEYARILGARALQISMGAPVLVLEQEEQEEQEQGDPLLISEREIRQGLLPILVRRTLPDGRYQDIPLPYLLKEAGRKHGGILTN